MRTLTFPTERSFGVVYCRRPSGFWGGREEWWPGAWERFLAKLSDPMPGSPPPARGTVEIPTGIQVRLWSSQVDANGKHLPAELEMLRAFGPSTFDSLAVLWPADGEQLTHIQHLTGLRELVVLSRFGDAGFADLGSLGSLRSLDLGYNPGLTDAGVATLLARNSDLEYVYLSGTGITDASLDALASKELTVLELGKTGITDAGVALLRGQTGLVSLKLHETAIADAALGAVAHTWRSLQALDLSGTAIADPGVATLGVLPGLRILRLSKTGVSAEALDADIFRSIETLALDDTGLTDIGLHRVAQLPRLRSLSMYGSAVGDTGLRALHGHPALRVLSLSGDAITNLGVLALIESLADLREVYFGMHVARSPEAIELLREQLRADG